MSKYRWTSYIYLNSKIQCWILCTAVYKFHWIKHLQQQQVKKKINHTASHHTTPYSTTGKKITYTHTRFVHFRQHSYDRVWIQYGMGWIEMNVPGKWQSNSEQNGGKKPLSTSRFNVKKEKKETHQNRLNAQSHSKSLCARFICVFILIQIKCYLPPDVI